MTRGEIYWCDLNRGAIGSEQRWQIAGAGAAKRSSKPVCTYGNGRADHKPDAQELSASRTHLHLQFRLDLSVHCSAGTNADGGQAAYQRKNWQTVRSHHAACRRWSALLSFPVAERESR